MVVADPITHNFIVQLVTLLFRLSTTCIIPLLLVVVVKSILFFSKFINTFFAAPGCTVTGIIIGSTHGIFIVIVSLPALNVG